MRNVAVAVVFLALTSLFLVTGAWADPVGGGPYTGTDSNSLYTSVASIKFDETLGVVTISGTVAITPKGKTKAVKLKLSGVQTGDSFTGFITSKNGASFPFTCAVGDLGKRYILEFQSGTYGSFGLRMNPASDLRGTWVFNDGTVMTIKKTKTGYLGVYTGTAGHENLRATLSGPFVNGKWTGEYHLKELSVELSGSFKFKFIKSTPPRLAGSITTQNGKAEYTLEKVG